MITTHKDLIVWKKSMSLVKDIYAITRSFPKEELYGIASQMRRAAVSIPSNIAEGFGRSTDKEILHFLYYALGSASELETQIIICKELEYYTEQQFLILDQGITEIIKMLSSLINTKKLGIK